MISALLFALLVQADRPPDRTPPRFEGRVETVYVNASVLRGGVPVTGLSAADFVVKDNGVTQSVRLEDVEQRPLSVTLVFDVSGSLDESELAQLRAAAHALAERLRPQDTVALVAVAHDLRLIVPRTNDLSRLRGGLDTLDSRGRTAICDGLYAALRLGEGVGRSLVVAFTDGEDNMSWLEADQALAAAESSDATIQIVGVVRDEGLAPRVSGPGDRSLPTPPPEPPWRHAMRRIAEVTGGRFVDVKSASELTRTFVEILEALRASYVLAYEPEGVAREGAHKLEVKLRRGPGEVRARTGYVIPPAR